MVVQKLLDSLPYRDSSDKERYEKTLANNPDTSLLMATYTAGAIRQLED
jgi:cytidylate kinase